MIELSPSSPAMAACVVHVKDVKPSEAYLKAQAKLASKGKQLEGKHFQMTAKLYQFPKYLRPSGECSMNRGCRRLECDPITDQWVKEFP